jgi:ketosteroid isomerase-like protein
VITTRRGLREVNRGDFATAFAGLAPDCEWHPFESALEGPLVGPKQVCHYFEDVIGTFPDLQNEPVHFLQVDDSVFVVLHRWRGSGRASGARTGINHAQVWELQEGIPVRVREFLHWEEALSAAGLDPASAVDLRRADGSGG